VRSVSAGFNGSVLLEQITPNAREYI